MSNNLVKQKSRGFKKESITGLVLSLGPVIGFLIFGLIPMVIALWLSLYSVKGFTFEKVTFIGMKNFTDILKDPDFLLAIKNTLLAAVGMPISLVLSLFVASLLNQKVLGTKVFRTIFFLPFVCSVAAVALMWKWMYNFEYGVLNSILKALNKDGIDWLGDKSYFMMSMILMGVWGGMGFGIILYSASLGNVSRSYYEAASIDGANRIQQFFHVTLPGISPTTFYLLVMGLIGALQDFSRFQIMGDMGVGDTAGPKKTGLTLVFYLYRMIWDDKSAGLGKASAMALIIAVLIVIVTAINFRVSKRWVHND